MAAVVVADRTADRRRAAQVEAAQVAAVLYPPRLPRQPARTAWVAEEAEAPLKGYRYLVLVAVQAS